METAFWLHTQKMSLIWSKNWVTHNCKPIWLKELPRYIFQFNFFLLKDQNWACSTDGMPPVGDSFLNIKPIKEAFKPFVMCTWVVLSKEIGVFIDSFFSSILSGSCEHARQRLSRQWMGDSFSCMSGVNNITISTSHFPERPALYQCFKYQTSTIHQLLFILHFFSAFSAQFGLPGWDTVTGLVALRGAVRKWDFEMRYLNILFCWTIKGCVGSLGKSSDCGEFDTNGVWLGAKCS